MNLTQPGAGLDVSALAKGTSRKYTEAGKALTFADFMTHIVPSRSIDAFANGDVLQVVFFAVLFGVGARVVGEEACAHAGSTASGCSSGWSRS